MEITRILQKIMNFIPKSEGAAGKITLNDGLITALTSHDAETAEIVQKALQGIKEPKLDVAYKAKSNYAIAGIRLRDGEKVVSQGAVSITHPGSSNGVVKYHFSTDNGQSHFATGFIDAGKPADTTNMTCGMSRRNGMIYGNTEIGEVASHRFRFKELDGVKFAQIFGGDEISRLYASFTNNLQRQADRFMVDFRNILRGGSSTDKTTAKIASDIVVHPPKSKDIDEILKAAEHPIELKKYDISPNEINVNEFSPEKFDNIKLVDVDDVNSKNTKPKVIRFD